MAPILETGLSCRPEPLLYGSLEASRLLSLVQLQARPTDSDSRGLHQTGLGLEECGIHCGTLGWSQAMSCFGQQAPQGRAFFCKLQHVMRIPLKQPRFCFEPMKYDFTTEHFPKWQNSYDCTEGKEQTRNISQKCLDPAGKRGCQGFPLTESVASHCCVE